ncbi:uncharacterized protein BDW43DRAFT_274949 [Aspergillus alliaceus]|uniref:uncharacterized protein n=1 Tax=Petromyces alliaceus TaxID=209559 RepID=UPI0012A3EE3C|nr:uncharacterized protein BDW43DRAFT_274949 [Aspergillus alliaceus]KAB8233731.1 hypothetical protein BDW43DRAFT_274949 [Aspergillus alliaceus]
MRRRITHQAVRQPRSLFPPRLSWPWFGFCGGGYAMFCTVVSPSPLRTVPEYHVLVVVVERILPGEADPDKHKVAAGAGEDVRSRCRLGEARSRLGEVRSYREVRSLREDVRRNCLEYRVSITVSGSVKASVRYSPNGPLARSLARYTG